MSFDFVVAGYLHLKLRVYGGLIVNIRKHVCKSGCVIAFMLIVVVLRYHIDIMSHHHP